MGVEKKIEFQNNNKKKVLIWIYTVKPKVFCIIIFCVCENRVFYNSPTTENKNSSTNSDPIYHEDYPSLRWVRCRMFYWVFSCRCFRICFLRYSFSFLCKSHWLQKQRQKQTKNRIHESRRLNFTDNAFLHLIIWYTELTAPTIHTFDAFVNKPIEYNELFYELEEGWEECSCRSCIWWRWDE